MALTVELVSPERTLWEGEASMVVARTLGGGDIAFLPGHVPFLGALDIWPVTVYLIDETEQQIAVHGGFVSVAEDKVTVLSDDAELGQEIDVVATRAALDEAQAQVEADDDLAAQIEVKKNEARLLAAGETASSH
jgi:F-type H+-transporting ATPase subunit epsilon